jgi:hypothetical protein
VLWRHQNLLPIVRSLYHKSMPASSGCGKQDLQRRMITIQGVRCQHVRRKLGVERKHHVGKRENKRQDEHHHFRPLSVVYWLARHADRHAACCQQRPSALFCSASSVAALYYTLINRFVVSVSACLAVHSGVMCVVPIARYMSIYLQLGIRHLAHLDSRQLPIDRLAQSERWLQSDVACYAI